MCVEMTAISSVAGAPHRLHTELSAPAHPFLLTLVPSIESATLIAPHCQLRYRQPKSPQPPKLPTALSLQSSLS
jgi:hypothetical protein